MKRKFEVVNLIVSCIGIILIPIMLLLMFLALENPTVYEFKFKLVVSIIILCELLNTVYTIIATYERGKPKEEVEG